MSVFTKRRKESYKLLESIEGLPKHDYCHLDIISPPAVIAIIGLIVTVIVFVVTV